MTRADLVGLLSRMQGSKASDLILTVGARPQMRINGALQPVSEAPILEPETTEMAAATILNEEQIAELREKRSLDFSRTFEGLSRYRINVYYQRDTVGMAIRLVPFVVPPLRRTGPAGNRQGLRASPARSGADHRSGRGREVHHAGGHD